MKEIVLNGEDWQTQDDVYNAFFKSVGAPSWHGRNLNALNDSIGTGDINQMEVPYILKIKGVSLMSSEARQMVGHFSELIQRLKKEGIEVDLVCE